MRHIILILGMFLLGINGSVDSSDIRSSLTFVIDDTGSMSDDIAQVKKGANAIFDTVMTSNSSQIEDFVLVTFNDPKTKLWAKTNDRNVFKNALNTIEVHGGDDCPEMAMGGIDLALHNSRDGSSLYVFTDASAKDYKKYDEVVALSQKMGCQIVFILTGICDGVGGKQAPHYLVYKKLAEATSGQVFNLQRNEIGEILEYVKLNIKDRKNVLTSKTFPGGHGAFDVAVDADMKELVISVSGKSPSVSVTDSGGTKWPTTDVTRLSEIAVVKVVGVTPDLYTLEVDSKDETQVVVSASTSVHFQHGFSTVEPSAITDTVRQPVPGEKSHLSIKLSTEGTDVELRSVRIMDMNDEVILEAPLKLVDKADQFYTTAHITPPGHLFKIAIKGYDVKTKTFLTRISLTPVQPQEFKRDTVKTKAPVVVCKTEVTAAYGKPLQLKCRVSGWPKPDVIWQSDVKSTALSHFESTLELPYDYVSVVEVPNVIKTATYTCKAVNSEGEGSASILVAAPLTCRADGINGSVDSSDIRSSLTFVIDDTGSMSDDIAQVKKGANAIFDTVMNSNSSQIEDFVLVTFNDPKTKRWAKTNDRKVFKNALNTIEVHGGDDCPEMAMGGIDLALHNSREGSSLYVFTDASAKDYKKYDEVVALSQKMGCQVVFILTGICYDFGGKQAPHYLVYKKLAEATSGQVFHLQRNEIGMILEYVQLNIKDRKNVLTSKTFPGGHGAFDVAVDADMKELVISVSGKSPSVSVTDSGGTKWPTTNVTRLSEIAVVKVVGVTPDVYTVEVDSKDETQVVVSASTSVHFQHGFSTVEPSAITDTVRQPVPGEKSHLSIKLSTEGTDVELRSVQIMDMNDEVILEAPLKLVDKAEQFYTTAHLTPPGHLFKVAIKGYDVKTKTFLTRISLTPVQPQEFKRDTVKTKAPVVVCKTEVTAAYGKPLQLKCRVSGWPKPDVIWQSDVKSTALSHFESTVELPYNYVSVVEVPNVIKNATYTCKAVNSEGEVSASILVHTKQNKYFKTVAAPKDITIKYQTSVVIPCKVEAHPPAKVTWYKGGHVLKPDANIQLSADGSALTIRSMEPYIADNYICEARNSVGRRLFRFKVDISGVEELDIDKTITSIKVVKNSRADIQCLILKGIPTPTIHWYYKEMTAPEFINLYETSDTIHLDNVDTTNAGTYRCIAENIMGLDYHEIDLIVEYAPSIPKHYKSTVTVNEGDTVTLRCPVVGAPIPEFTWTFRGHAVRSIERHSIFIDGTLRFSAISSDEGEYECEAKNPLGAARINIKLNVNVLPVLESPKKSSIEQMEGLPVTLPCRADGSPKPRLTWVYRSNDSTLGPRKFAPSDATGRLRFDSILLQQSGEYTCVAANSRGSRNITYSVSVLAPPTIHYTTKKFESVVDDMQLRIPCNNTGNPKPEITWTYGGYKIASGSKWFTIGEDGSLIIKNINKESQGTYTCRAFNKYGRTAEDFSVAVLDSPNPSFIFNEIQLEEGTSAIIPCSVPQQKTDRLRWFKDGHFLSSSVLELRNVIESDEGTYTCRVSSVDRPAQTGSMKVEVGFKPRFAYDDDKNIRFTLGEYALMDCTATGVPKPEVKWYHDDREISFNDFKYELEMSNDNDRGRYTCVVANRYGTVQQEFVISAFECLLDVTHLNGNEPLILTLYDKLNNFPTSDGFIHIPKDEVVKFACPSSFDTIRARDIILTCENEQQFLQKSSGRHYLYSDLKCRDKWQPIVKSTGRRCRKGNSEMFSVGFDIKRTFQEVYGVCVDRVSKNPIYTKLNMQPSLANVVANNDTEWFHNGSPVDLDSLYDCSNQNAEITSILNTEFHRDGCCFAKRMLVNPRDVAAGMPQATTYTPFNVALHWSTCNSKNWDDVERRIRNLVTSSNRPLQVWTGTAEDLQLPDSSYEQKNVVIRSSGRNVQVPKYLWKVVQDPYTKASLAIVQVNVPDLKLAEARSYMLCKDVCRQAEWMRRGRWRTVEQGFTYCCSLGDFERAFRLYAAFPSYDKLLLQLSDIPDDHYLHAI